MRTAIVATAAGAAALIAASMLGVASAEAPTTTPIRTVTVEGVAIVPIAQGASAATATAAYRQGMSAAVADGQSKAEYLAGRVGGTIGAAQSVGEGGGSITCIGDGESQYVEYTGEQPDFGYGSSPVVEAGGRRNRRAAEAGATQAEAEARQGGQARARKVGRGHVLHAQRRGVARLPARLTLRPARPCRSGRRPRRRAPGPPPGADLGCGRTNLQRSGIHDRRCPQPAARDARAGRRGARARAGLAERGLRTTR